MAASNNDNFENDSNPNVDNDEQRAEQHIIDEQRAEEQRIEEQRKAEEERRRLEEQKVKTLEHKGLCFDKELRLLIKQLQEILRSKYGILANDQLALKYLIRYLNIYNSMKPEEHYVYIESLYNKNRMYILNMLVDDGWLRNGRLVIQFGEGIKGMAEKCKGISIQLSDIYNVAIDLQSAAEEAAQGDDGADLGDDKDIIRPQIIQLHLMRLFYYLNDTPDKPKIEQIVSKIEEQLNIPVEKRTVATEKIFNQQFNVVANNGVNPLASGLAGIFDMTKGVLQQFGITPPEDMNTPSQSVVMTALNNFFNSNTTQNIVRSTIEEIKECDGLASAAQVLLKKVADPATVNAIETSLTNSDGTSIFGNNGVPSLPSIFSSAGAATNSAASSSGASSSEVNYSIPYSE